MTTHPHIEINNDRGERIKALAPVIVSASRAILSKDIGIYDTCPHGCLYCYANNSPQSAIHNWLSNSHHD